MDMQPIRGAESTPPVQRIKDAKSSSSAGETSRASRSSAAASASGQGKVETPERARVKALVQTLVQLPDDRSDAIASAREKLDSGFFHSEEGLRATAERLLGPPE